MRAWAASEQQSLSAGPADVSPRSGGETSGRSAWAETRGYVFPEAAGSLCPSRRRRVEGAIAAIVDCVRELDAGSIFVSWRHDPHCDHEASYRIARQVQRRVGEVRLFEYVVWGHALPPSTEVGPIQSGFRIRLDDETLEKKRRAIAAHPRRQAISSTTTPPDFSSLRSTWPISIGPMNSFLRAGHERTAPNAPA
jgi:hypothetical protein